MDATADLEEYKFMFKQRLISGIILVLIAAFGLYMGGIVTFAMTLIVALIGYSEILKIYHIEKSSLAVIGYTGTILYYVALLFDLDQWTTAIIILFLIFLLGCYVVRFPKYKVDQMMAGFFGFVYVAILMSFIYQIRELQNGGEFVVLLFLAAWGNDTLAYCTGMLIGKHKMSPILSPKKSIEGLVGGTDFGLLAYNETPAYEVIDRGITTLSIDWEKMGTLTADFILTGKQIHTYLPTEIRLRGSL